MTTFTPSQENMVERLEMIDTLKSFLVTAPNGQHDAIKQHVLNTTGESITCVRWNDAFYITGTDIVRCLVFRFYAFGRPVQNLKKFEEGIFSDLRNLKPGTDAILEEPKSPFLDLLFKNNCIRTQKKQKVFFWYSVPHDRLFLDALERDLKREKLGVYPTSASVAHPAVAISLDTTQAMFDDFRKSMLSEMNLQSFYLQQQQQQNQQQQQHQQHQQRENSSISSVSSSDTSCSISDSSVSPDLVSSREGDLQKASSAIFGQFSLFEGSPTYKQRRRRVTQKQQQQQTQVESKYIRKKSCGFTSSTTTVTNNQPDTLAIWSSDTSNNNTDDDTSSPVRYFNCPLASCGKHFKRLEHMKRHLRTHTMERPYLCDLCGKRFSRSDNLAQHKKTHQRLRILKGENDDDEDDNNDEDDDEDSSSDDRNYMIKKSHYNGNVSTKSSTLSRRTGKQSIAATSIRRAVNMTTMNYNSNGKRIVRSSPARRQQQYKNNAPIIETEVIYDSDWSQQHDSIEYLKSDVVVYNTPPPQQLLLSVPKLSVSTATSSASSCDSSPIHTRPPTIKIEDTEIFYDLSNQQQQMNDTAMMMVEELLPQQNQYWEDESASDWQRRVDWNQYSSPRPITFDTDDSIIDNYNSFQDIQSYYYLHQQAYNQYPPESCLTSPLFGPTTTSSNSTVTTAANSPIARTCEFYPPHYFSDESPTMTPSDALLQH